VGIIEDFKDVLKLADAANNLDLYKKLAELQNSVLGLQEENQTLKERLREAEKLNDIAGRLHVRDNAYYLNDGKQLDGPFCMRCWDVGSQARQRAPRGNARDPFLPSLQNTLTGSAVPE
jgi:hypothetical protein